MLASSAPRAAGCSLLVALVVLAVARSAHADPAAAQALFEQGQQLMLEGRFDEACPKIAESQRLDPAGGTLVNLATCYQRQGRIATAWETFKSALTVARRDGHAQREAFALEQIAELEPRRSFLTLSVPPPARIDGLVVTRDGTVLGEAAWGVELPTDPGEHVVTARAPGHRAWEQRVEVGPQADRQEVVVPALVALTSVSPKLPPSPSPSPPPPAPGDPMPPLRIGGFVTAGVGLAAVVAGAVAGGLALGKDGEADEAALRAGCAGEGLEQSCPPGPDGADAAAFSEEAGTLATASNVLLFGGGALLVGGALMAWLAPEAQNERARLVPNLAPGHAGLTFVLGL